LGPDAIRPSMMPDADIFVAAWAAAWNAHDIDAVLAHFHADATFRSPIARDLIPQSAGILRGKQEIKAYWTQALMRIPDLAFTIQSHAVGLDLIAISYRNQRDTAVIEVLFFEDGLVRTGYAAYPLASANPAGMSP
jgi:hypothetical protein